MRGTEGCPDMDTEQGEVDEGEQHRNMYTRTGKRLPKIEVRFQGLCVDAEVRVGRRSLPTLLNTTINAAESRNSLQ
ncbi:hypothetical protein Taro_014615 [Colocasia esculenta]|uniref:Uncharacterized protein n=1 Tax=Colocasia esculenta TaxID=4460 RepID=A0A843UFF2_COLES|nr:hypothetical protein [Colocasia esculenta]